MELTMPHGTPACEDSSPSYEHTDIATCLKTSQEKCVRRHKNRAVADSIHRSESKDGDDFLADSLKKGSYHLHTTSSDAVPSLSKSLKQVPLEAELDADKHFNFDDLWTIQAPMVRCSRPPFRKLCRLWGTKINYTHMILADSFVRSSQARESEFALYHGENRLITQIAGTNPPVMAAAAAMVAPFCDAIDINCGCPQRWAMKEGIGSAMLQKPELVADIVKCVRNSMPAIDLPQKSPNSSNLSTSSSMSHIPCVVKMRVYDDVQKSVEFARQAESAGAGWITVHGRTPWCVPTARVRTEAIRLIRESVNIPVVANGGVGHPYDAMSLAVDCGVGGVMCATGLLHNPAIFYRFDWGSQFRDDELQIAQVDKRYELSPSTTMGEKLAIASHWSRPPLPVVADYLKLSVIMDLPLKATAHHFLMMANDYLTPSERTFVSQQRSVLGLLDCAANLGFFNNKGKV